MKSVWLVVAAVIGLGSAAHANAYCSEPSAPFCADQFGPFDDDWDFDSCRSEMESYRSDVEEFAECHRGAADDAIEEARSAIEQANSDYNDAVESFNRRAGQ